MILNKIRSIGRRRLSALQKHLKTLVMLENNWLLKDRMKEAAQEKETIKKKREETCKGKKRAWYQNKYIFGKKHSQFCTETMQN